MQQKTISGTLLLAMLALLLIACAKEPYAKDSDDNLSVLGIKKFSSQKELTEYLRNAPSSGTGIRSLEKASSMAIPEAASDYSQTNVQVEGVDEADFVKNDGKYIYVVAQGKLVIADAHPAESAKILSRTEIPGSPRNLFINRDRAVVFSDGYDEIYTISEYDFVPRPTSTSFAHLLIYDISDRSSPRLLKDYKIKGYYFDSRMIGDYAYFAVNENVYYYGGPVPMPRILEASKTVVRPDVYYFDNPEDSYSFNTVGSLNIFSESLNAKTFMMGYSNTMYMSQNAIYIAYQKNMPGYWSRENDRFYKAVLPLFPSEVQDRINAVNNGERSEKWSEILAIIEEMYNGMGEGEKKELIKKTQKGLEEYDLNLQKENAKTVIHKISIDNGEMEYSGRGEVEGRMLNQFSLDEFQGNLRVATTTELYAREAILYNNVYVLDNGMNSIGKLEKLAPDERIYSARFMGEKLYMVTFKRIDPLFVIDLSSPENPRVLGELKIPGYSDYLHPYDENHIIGIGKETGDNEWGGVSVKGVKVALFDVSDVENPKQIGQYEIGEAGTDSEALRDHKAFLFDREKNLLVIPITEVAGKIYDPRYGYYRQNYWQGAYAFTITEAGIELKGKVSHDEEEEGDSYYYYGGQAAVRRSLFMDNVLYTISGKKIKMNELANLSNGINELELPYDDYYGPVIRRN